MNFTRISLPESSLHQSAITKKPSVIFEKAIKANPKRSAAYLFLGQSQLELNDLTSAEKNLRQAIELSEIRREG